MLTPEFLLTSLVVVLIPGTGVLYTVSTGLFHGRRASIAAAVGCTAGILPHLLAAILGLTAILNLSSNIFQLLKYGGAAYLLYLAWGIWRETGAISFTSDNRSKGSRQIIVKAILINFLNPKLSIFFLAFLPQFISTSSTPPMLQLFVLSGVFMAMTLGVFVLYGLTAHQVRRHVIDSPKIRIRLQRSFAGVFALLGLRLALADR